MTQLIFHSESELNRWRVRYEKALRDSLDARKKLNYYLYLQRRAENKSEARLIWSREASAREEARKRVKLTGERLASIIASRPMGTRARHRLEKGSYTTKPEK